MRISKLYTTEQLQNVLLTDGDLTRVDGRCSGKTTGIVLKAFGYAMTNPNVTVKIIEKEMRRDSHILNSARSLREQLHLKYLYVHREANEIHVIFRIHAEISLGDNNHIKFEL